VRVQLAAHLLHLGSKAFSFGEGVFQFGISVVDYFLEWINKEESDNGQQDEE